MAKKTTSSKRKTSPSKPKTTTPEKPALKEVDPPDQRGDSKLLFDTMMQSGRAPTCPECDSMVITLMKRPEYRKYRCRNRACRKVFEWRPSQ